MTNLREARSRLVLSPNLIRLQQTAPHPVLWKQLQDTEINDRKSEKIVQELRRSKIIAIYSL